MNPKTLSQWRTHGHLNFMNLINHSYSQQYEKHNDELPILEQKSVENVEIKLYTKAKPLEAGSDGKKKLCENPESLENSPQKHDYEMTSIQSGDKGVCYDYHIFLTNCNWELSWIKDHEPLAFG